MSIDTLQSYIENPELWELDLSTQSIKDVLSEIASRVDKVMQTDRKRTDEFQDRVRPEELRAVSNRLDDVAKRAERQATEYSTEMRELKAYLTFQLRDLRENIIHDPNSSTPISLPAFTPPPPSSQQFSTDLQRLTFEMDEIRSQLKNVMKAVADSKRLAETSRPSRMSLPPDGEEEDKTDSAPPKPTKKPPTQPSEPASAAEPTPTSEAVPAVEPPPGEVPSPEIRSALD
jgi:hypothetical protein